MVILTLLQLFSIFYLDLLILEMVYGSQLMPAFDLLWIVGHAYRIGVIRNIFTMLYEKSQYWRRICYHVRKLRKAVMTSWNKQHFIDFEKAWEVSIKSKHRKAKINRATAYFLQDLSLSKRFNLTIKDTAIYEIQLSDRTDCLMISGSASE